MMKSSETVGSITRLTNTRATGSPHCSVQVFRLVPVSPLVCRLSVENKLTLSLTLTCNANHQEHRGAATRYSAACYSNIITFSSNSSERWDYSLKLSNQITVTNPSNALLHLSDGINGGLISVWSLRSADRRSGQISHSHVVCC